MPKKNSKKMDSRELRIVFMGTPEFAVTPLRRLVEGGYNVVGVVTAPDKPSGRGLRINQSAVKEYAVEVGLRVMQPEKLRDPQFVDEFAELKADLAIVIAFRMLPEVIWSMPRLGTFNLHASLLPQYRGAAPINWAVINGEKVTGVTTFMLNHEIDKGAVLGQREVEIEGNDTAGTLHDKLMRVGTELVVESVDKIASGRAEAVEQAVSESGLRLAPKIFKEDCRVDWSKGVEQVHNLIRGLSPYPTAWGEMRLNSGGEAIVVKIYKAHVGEATNKEQVGKVVSDGRTYLKVACGDDYIYIDELQMAGKRRMSTVDFLMGFKGVSGYLFG